MAARAAPPVAGAVAAVSWRLQRRPLPVESVVGRARTIKMRSQYGAALAAPVVLAAVGVLAADLLSSAAQAVAVDIPAARAALPNSAGTAAASVQQAVPRVAAVGPHITSAVSLAAPVVGAKWRFGFYDDAPGTDH